MASLTCCHGGARLAQGRGGGGTAASARRRTKGATERNREGTREIFRVSDPSEESHKPWYSGHGRAALGGRGALGLEDPTPGDHTPPRDRGMPHPQGCSPILCGGIGKEIRTRRRQMGCHWERTTRKWEAKLIGCFFHCNCHLIIFNTIDVVITVIIIYFAWNMYRTR